MKTITIKQPWASLIVEGVKDIENRTWPTKFRGRVLIHAAHKRWKWEAVLNYLYDKAKAILNSFGYDATWLKQLPTGVIIGSVEIVDCMINHPSTWAEKSGRIYDGIYSNEYKIIYNWVLANPILFPEPIPAKGKLSFWDYPHILAEPEEKDGTLFCHCNIPVKEGYQVRTNGDGTYSCRYCGGQWYK